MIYYANSKAKVVALSLLVIATTGLIGWQWLKFAPWTKVASTPSPQLQQVGEEIKDTAAALQENFSVGQDQLKDVQAEIVKEPERQELLQVANEYILEKESAAATPDNNSQGSVETPTAN